MNVAHGQRHENGPKVETAALCPAEAGMEMESGSTLLGWAKRKGQTTSGTRSNAHQTMTQEEKKYPAGQRGDRHGMDKQKNTHHEKMQLRGCPHVTLVFEVFEENPWVFDENPWVLDENLCVFDENL